MLRVKLKSLAAEARIIRHEERRTRGELRQELHAHRVKDVRGEARATHLAYGFIRGMSYTRTEPGHEASPTDGPVWERVAQMVAKYGARDHRDKAVAQRELRAWREVQIAA